MAGCYAEIPVAMVPLSSAASLAVGIPSGSVLTGISWRNCSGCCWQTGVSMSLLIYCSFIQSLLPYKQGWIHKKNLNLCFQPLLSHTGFNLMASTLFTSLPLLNSTIFLIQQITMTTSYFPSLSPHGQLLFSIDTASSPYPFSFCPNKTKPGVNVLWGR